MRTQIPTLQCTIYGDRTDRFTKSFKQKVAFRAIKHLNFDKNKNSIAENYILIQAKKTDLNSVLKLNQKFLPAVGDSDLDEMNHFLEISSYFKIIKVEEKPIGFLIGLLPGLNYGSENYKWFSAIYSSFIYVDRVVIDSKNQNKGFGKIFYNDLKDTFYNKASIMTCEVNIRPYNKQSIDFHKKYGFKEVGTKNTENNKKTVSYMIYHFD